MNNDNKCQKGKNANFVRKIAKIGDDSMLKTSRNYAATYYQTQEEKSWLLRQEKPKKDKQIEKNWKFYHKSFDIKKLTTTPWLQKLSSNLLSNLKGTLQAPGNGNLNNYNKCQNWKKCKSLVMLKCWKPLSYQ